MVEREAVAVAAALDGGALYVANGANATVSNVSLQNNLARGGNGGGRSLDLASGVAAACSGTAKTAARPSRGSGAGGGGGDGGRKAAPAGGGRLRRRRWWRRSNATGRRGGFGGGDEATVREAAEPEEAAPGLAVRSSSSRLAL